MSYATQHLKEAVEIGREDFLVAERFAELRSQIVHSEHQHVRALSGCLVGRHRRRHCGLHAEGGGGGYGASQRGHRGGGWRVQSGRADAASTRGALQLEQPHAAPGLRLKLLRLAATSTRSRRALMTARARVALAGSRNSYSRGIHTRPTAVSGEFKRRYSLINTGQQIPPRWRQR